jgi:NAD(P)-dependent dehydrogenase (short-subunit alcohol dehydrogenase family)
MTTSEKIALITGASSGIGRALADELKQHGFLVYATARKPTDLTALTAAGFQALLLDVNDPLAIEQAVATIRQQHNRLDLLINNAGFGAMGPVLDCSPAQLQLQFQTNVFSLVQMTRSFLPLLHRNGGTVVNIGSVSADFVTPYAGVYCASKAAVHAINTALRLELAPFGIQVILVQPGAIASEFGATATLQAEQTLNAQSLWWPLREGVRRRARASQQKPTPTPDFARTVVSKLLQPQPPRLIRAGYGSTILPLLARCLPGAALDWILRRQFLLPAAGSMTAGPQQQKSDN